MSRLLQDARHAVRLYRRTPGATAMVVVVLAVGMAFVTAFLSLYSDLVLRPEPGYAPGGRIVTVGCSCGTGGLPLDLIERIDAESTTLEHLAGVMAQQFQVGPDSNTTPGTLVTRQFFPGLRPSLLHGRGFTAAEHVEDGEAVVVISWRYWQEQFAGVPDILGKTLLINVPPTPGPRPGLGGHTATDFRIVGVTARDFAGTSVGETAFWMPLERGLPIVMPMPAVVRAQMMRNSPLQALARRSGGVSNRAVLSELKGRFSQDEFMQQPGAQFQVLDNVVNDAITHREMQRQLRLFLAASVLLVLVAAANVGLFLLARAPGRRRELGIRMAVGAPLKRLAWQLASEAAVLVGAAALIGFATSIWLARFLGGLPFLRFAQWRDVTLLDWRVLFLVGLLLLLLTLLVSLAPILSLKKLGIAQSSRQVAARATAMQWGAGVAQIAVAGALSGAAIAFAWHLAAVLLAYPGYRIDNVYAATYSASAPRRAQARNADQTAAGIVDRARYRESFASVPGVSDASLATAVPGVDMGSSIVAVPDPENQQQSIQVESVRMDSQYVDLLDLQLLHGRNIRDGETAVLVNQSFAQRFFGRENVAGETLPTLADSVPGGGQTRMQALQIVGVLKDVPFRHPLANINPMVFTTTGASFSGVIVVESALPASALQEAFATKARELDMTVRRNLVPLATVRSEVLAPDRARGLLTIVTGVLVVLLAALGFYGTQRYLVLAGRREYAIRASLGAGPRALGRLVLRRGMLLGLPGVLVAAPLAYILVAWLRGEYVSQQVSPLLVAMAVTAGVVLLLLAASFGPARMARRTQPAPLLRED